MKSHLRRIRISPKKANIVAGLIRGKTAQDALNILRFTPKKASTFLYKGLVSAVANAENNDNVPVANLVIDQVIVNKATALRRFIPSARGRALPLRKPMSHVSIFLRQI
jgi:large subunit ribosomal protein L22